MLLGIFIFMQFMAICLFLAAFFTKQEILWAITAVISGMLMYSSYYVQVYTYEFNATVGAYVTILTSESYPYLMAFNMMFFGLAVVLGFFDVFEKYGINLFNRK